MDFLSVIAITLVVCSILAGLWFFSRKKAAAHAEQVKEIRYLLDRVAEAATKRKTQLYESLDGSDHQALSALAEAAKDSPIDVSDEIQQMNELWAQLSKQLAEFSNQSVQSTLQSSVVTTRAAVTADQIAKLVQAIKVKLNG